MTKKINILPTERGISIALGGALLLHSFSRGSFALKEKVFATALLYRGIRGHSYLYQALGIGQDSSQTTRPYGVRRVDDALAIERSLTIEKPAEELYHFWHTPQQLASLLGEGTKVTEGNSGQLACTFRLPFNRRLVWELHVAEERPGELLRWQSYNNPLLPYECTVRFSPAPKDWGTEVTLQIRFHPPGGMLGLTLIERLSSLPRFLMDKALRRCKSLAETGEIATLKHNPVARPTAYASV